MAHLYPPSIQIAGHMARPKGFVVEPVANAPILQRRKIWYTSTLLIPNICFYLPPTSIFANVLHGKPFSCSRSNRFGDDIATAEACFTIGFHCPSQLSNVTAPRGNGAPTVLLGDLRGQTFAQAVASDGELGRVCGQITVALGEIPKIPLVQPGCNCKNAQELRLALETSLIEP